MNVRESNDPYVFSSLNVLFAHGRRVKILVGGKDALV